ncbi:4-hydroxy-tetrahydrodipicolinate reductase [Mitsuokella sp. AF33-22]|uniref:4-hydroxy-tetrahydrodipicolinate reductase n=1 Tax=Mitsuokella sp. AF33-22 TaxID=2292047 RepID=UPI000E50AF07|nr:4-hydroxy-tetrahydrodipicolinate reductase [Mitsuokella sp. AF33-22]RHM55918.1 4-hydroxy-tetrahydrodipicolinate reductase [Mitsuokella sp. AF33-22]
MTTVIVNGACGRMGQAVLKAVQEADELELVGAVDIKGGADTGTLVGLPASGILVETDLEALLERKKPEVMVDFTRPDVVFGNVMTALKHGTSPVVGTTGLSDEQKAEIAKAAEENATPAFIAPNFAIGAVLLMIMSRQAAKYMPEVEIIELHHDKKLDAPSGTAIQTAEMIAEVRKEHQQGNPDEFEKLPGARGANYEGMHIHSVRLPGYVAHQEVIFGGLGQTLTIRHDSMNRESFMPGVVLAAKKVRSLKGLTVGLDKLLD